MLDSFFEHLIPLLSSSAVGGLCSLARPSLEQSVRTRESQCNGCTLSEQHTGSSLSCDTLGRDDSAARASETLRSAAAAVPTRSNLKVAPGAERGVAIDEFGDCTGPEFAFLDRLISLKEVLVGGELTLLELT